MVRTDTGKELAAKLRAVTRGVPPRGPLTDLDTQLMLQVREGSPAAADALVRRNFDRVSGYIARVVRDRRAVEDLTQEVFLQVLKHAPRYQPTARFSTWLYRVATNAALNYLNQAHVKNRRGPQADRAEARLADRSDTRPERRMSLDELRSEVAAAISGLPAKQRIALALFEFESLSYEQIAAVLDTSLESVRNLLKRARETLRGELAGLL